MKYSSLFLLCLIVSCATHKRNDNTSLERIVSERLTPNATIELNSMGSHALCYVIHKETLRVPANRLEFILVSIKDNKVIYEEQKFNAKVAWYNDEFVQVDSAPEVASKDRKQNEAMKRYYINIRSLKKVFKEPK